MKLFQLWYFSSSHPLRYLIISFILSYIFLEINVLLQSFKDSEKKTF